MRFSSWILCLLFCSCTHHAQMESAAAVQPQQSKTLSIKPLIVIDPGHGGVDMGAHCKYCAEKNLSLICAYFVKKHLNEKGYRVLLTRSKDTFISLENRAKAANQSQAKLFVSIHFNAAKATEAHGVEVYYFGKKENLRATKSKACAQAILSKLLRTTGASSRGVKSGNFHVIRETKMPAVLVEGGFITNPTEVKRLIDRKYLEKLSTAIADGIDQYSKAAGIF